MEYRETNFSLLRNPTLVFDNTVMADESSVNLPITHNDKVLGIITEVTNEKIYCKVWDKFIRFYPEFRSIDGKEPFNLSGINVSLPADEVISCRTSYNNIVKYNQNTLHNN